MERLTIYNNPARVEWAALTERCTRREEEITEQVAAILDEVRSGGDRALRAITQRIEGRTPDRQEVPAGEPAGGRKGTSPPELKEALAAAKANIEAFHRAQLPGEVRTETQPGGDVPPAGGTDPARGALHPGRKGAALLDGADAGRSGAGWRAVGR